MNDDRINDPDVQIDATIMKLVEQYASCDRRSADINDERATIRGNAEKLGFTSAEFQDGVRRVKKMSKTERDMHERNVSRIVNIAETRQAELWPKETERQRKRAEERASQPRTKAELDAKTDTDPASDPASGGAQVDIEQAIAEATARELAEGAVLLEGKSDAWRDGFNAFGAGAKPSDNPNDVVTSTERADWDAGYAAAGERAFESAKPSEPAGISAAIEALDREVRGEAAQATPKAAKAPKPSQSAKGNAKRAAAGLN